MEQLKLVGARKRKPKRISKITQEPESKSKLKLILDELKHNKSQLPTSFVKPLTPPYYPYDNPQEEPLDLSISQNLAVDLTNKEEESAVMTTLYQQYFNQSGSKQMRLGNQSEIGITECPRQPKLVCLALPRKQEAAEDFAEKPKKQLNPSGKPKQRRYRTDRPFVCPHCPAKFTLRSNMERHGKHQHPQIWQRSPSNRVLNKQKLLQQVPSSSTSSDSSARAALSSKLKRKLSENSDARDSEFNELASVDKLLKIESPMERGEEESEGEETSEESEEEGKKKSAYSSAPHKISCPHCTRRFPWTSSLRRHLLTHTGQKPYQCAKCPLLFTTKSNCDRHLIRKHSGASSDSDSEEEEGIINEEKNERASFRCHICDTVSSPNRAEILNHMETEHRGLFKDFKELVDMETSDVDFGVGGNRKVLCAFCLRRFWSVEDLRRHVRSHTGERPFSCGFCERKFTLKHSMMRHVKKHQ